MTGNLRYCISLLYENEESLMKSAHETLVKLCGNILSYPKELRYRRIRLSNETILGKLLPASGAIECLFEAGFLEMDDEFLLPADAPLDGVYELLKLLRNESSKREEARNDRESTSSGAVKIGVDEIYVKSQPDGYEFLRYLKAHFQGVLRYEDINLQNKVKSILPIERIQIDAMEKLRTVQREMKIKKKDYDVVFEDVLLSELLSWFKNKFFKWIDTLECEGCRGECYVDRSITSSNPQISRIEIHKCKICGRENQFPRFTDPEPLLHSRRGRCGEWATCFTLLCRVVGFDARYVCDETDHVWTEVWSVAHKRWIHADSCENAMDTPLMYEKGWSKKLSYVIAFSKDEIQDVTWRYTRDHQGVMKRRRRCPEKTLAAFMRKMNAQRQNAQGYSSVRRNFVVRRNALELADMLIAPPGMTKPSDEAEREAEYSGRTSGSLAWRISRDEVGKEAPRHRWLVPKGVTDFQLSYRILEDSYEARDIGTNVTLSTKGKWLSGVESTNGDVFRKEESDWKMVYLARSGPSVPGKVTWTFIIEDAANARLETVQLNAVTKTYHDANVSWDIEGSFPSDDGEKPRTKVVSTLLTDNYETNELKGAIELRVSVTLSGGDGDLAWQHAQLFRQSMNSNGSEPSLTIRIKLKNAS